MKTNIKNFFLATVCIGTLLTSCDIERLPNGSMAAEDITSDPNKALDGLVRGAYAQLKTWSDPMHRLGEYAGDNMMIRGSSTDAFYEFISFSRTAENYRLDAFWNSGYKAIAQTSNIIKMIEEGQSEDIDNKLGECYYIRGMMYFYLTRAYSRPYYQAPNKNLGVPIVNGTPDDLENLQLPDRSTVEESYAQAIADLRKAENMLTINEGPAYASIGAAQAMLSRVYLYMGKWQETYNSAEKVLLQKSSLEDFNKENSKIPNDFQSTEVITAYEYVCKDVDKAFRATPMLKEKYDRNDLRPNKYFDVADKNGNFPVLKCGSTQFSCSFRTGEIYLNAAEAAVHLNKLSEARGRLLKLIENRYTPEGYTLKKNEIEAMSQEALLAEIQEERTKELAFEGHRWFDLRRTTRPRIEKVIDGKTYILEKDDARYTLRIPQAAIDANPELQH